MVQNIGKILKGLTIIGYRIVSKIVNKGFEKGTDLGIKFSKARDEYRIRQGMPPIHKQERS